MKTLITSLLFALFTFNLSAQNLQRGTYGNGHVFTVQFRPEACAGPHDAAPLFNQFFAMMGGKN